jgi:hypothetical protein
MKKKKPLSLGGIPLTASHIQDPQQLESIIHHDDAYRVLADIRGTPAYYQKMNYKCLAKIRQLGTYIWFMTFSVADLFWTEIIQVVGRQYGEHFTDADVENMDWNTKQYWLRRNPVTATRHADYMFHQFMGLVVLAAPHPVGQICDYDIKKEEQKRGLIHFHGVFHVVDAPRLNENSDEEIVQFIDQYVSAELPVESKDPELHALVSHLQTHHHTRTCKKRGQACRFGYPKAPSPQTLLSKPPTGDNAITLKKESEVILKRVYTVMEDWDDTESLTTSNILMKANVPEASYVDALKISHNARSNVVLKRSPQAQNINNYNPHLLKAWRANMDIQYILDPYACIMYVTSYLCKAEKNMSELLRKVSRECLDREIRDTLRQVGNVFLTHREVSAPFATYLSCGMPITESTRSVEFIPTEVPEKRTRMLKSENELKKLPTGSTDVFKPNILDRYEARPDSLEDLCLADFVSHYVMIAAKKPQIESDDTGAVENGNAIGQSHQEENLNIADVSKETNLLQLKEKKLGKIRARKRYAVIRYHRVAKDKDPESFYHKMLLLYLPWRDEQQLLAADRTYTTKFKEAYEALLPNMSQYERLSDDIDAAAKAVQHGEQPEDAWSRIAAETEQSRLDPEDAMADPDFEMRDPDLDEDPLQQEDIVPSDTGRKTATSAYYTIHKLPNTEYHSLVRSLNAKQRLLHDFICEWCHEVSISNTTMTKAKPFYIFLSGGGGVGKSHTINAVYQAVYHALHTVGDNPEKIVALLTASTGCAAFNISGMTLHSALCLPRRERRGHAEYTPLSQDRLNTLRVNLEHLKVLIIDEVSMVGAETLLHVERRLREIMGIPNTDSETIFGGISILAVGDLLQLPPVADAAVFQPSKHDRMSRLYGSLWQNNFRLLELTEVQRQIGDPSFADILNRVRQGNKEPQDMAKLNTRVIKTDDAQYPKSILHIYATNKQVKEHNTKMLYQQTTDIITIKARDTKDLNVAISSKLTMSDDIHYTAGLHGVLQVTVGARVALTTNIDTSDGLVNGAQGTLTSINVLHADPLKGTIFINFDHPDVGKMAKQAFAKRKQLDGVPIKSHVSRFAVGSDKTFYVNRNQYPITLCWAATIHKVQGQTLDRIVASFDSKRPFTSGQAYVALSRTRTMDGLYLLDFDQQKISANKPAQVEMTRLQDQMVFHWNHQCLRHEDAQHLVHLNIRSFSAHLKDLLCNKLLSQAEFICLTETHLKSEVQPLSNMFNSFCNPSAHGIAAFISKQISSQKVPLRSTHDLEFLSLVSTIHRKRIIIVTLYRPPCESPGTFLRQLESLLTHLPLHLPTIITGDFNIDLLKSCSASANLRRFMEVQGFTQLITHPTHRDGGLLDHIYVNNMVTVLSAGTIDCYYSDHQAIYLSFQVE